MRYTVNYARSKDIHTVNLWLSWVSRREQASLGQTSPPATAGLVIVDTRPPTATLEPLPPYHDQPDVTLRWSGDDPAPGTGVAGYDVQHRVGAGEWHTLSSGCTGEAAHGEPGRLYTFRLTATDNVGNEASAEAEAGVPRATKYYYHGGKRVAMRVQNPQGGFCQAESCSSQLSAVYYLHG